MRRILAVVVIFLVSLPISAVIYRGSNLRVISPGYGNYKVNSILKIEWEAGIYPDSLTIYLKRDNRTIKRLATLENLSPLNNREKGKAMTYFYWRITEDIPSGSGYYIEIVTRTGQKARSATFTITGYSGYPGYQGPGMGRIQPFIANRYLLNLINDISIKFNLKKKKGTIYFMGNTFAYLKLKTAIPRREYIIDSSGPDDLHVDLISRRAFFRFGGTLNWASFNLYKKGNEYTLVFKRPEFVEIFINLKERKGMLIIKGRKFIKLTVRGSNGKIIIQAGGRNLILEPTTKVLKFESGNRGIWARVVPVK